MYLKSVTIFFDDDGAVLSPNKLSDQPEMLSKSCYRIFFKKLFKGIFYWLTDRCIQTHITRQWLRLQAWFFCCSTSLLPERCLLPCHCTYNAFFMDLPGPSFVSPSSLLTMERCRFCGRHVMVSIPCPYNFLRPRFSILQLTSNVEPVESLQHHLY